MILGREWSPMELLEEPHKRSDECQKMMQPFVDNWAQHFVVCWFSTIFFPKLLFTWIWWFFFQETHNNRLKERYENNPSIYLDINPDLWLKAGSCGGPDKNQVYELSYTTIENLRMNYSISTIEFSQSVPSTQSLEFAALLDQEV